MRLHRRRHPDTIIMTGSEGQKVKGLRCRTGRPEPIEFAQDSARGAVRPFAGQSVSAGVEGQQVLADRGRHTLEVMVRELAQPASVRLVGESIRAGLDGTSEIEI